MSELRWTFFSILASCLAAADSLRVLADACRGAALRVLTQRVVQPTKKATTTRAAPTETGIPADWWSRASGCAGGEGLGIEPPPLPCNKLGDGDGAASAARNCAPSGCRAGGASGGGEGSGEGGGEGGEGGGEGGESGGGAGGSVAGTGEGDGGGEASGARDDGDDGGDGGRAGGDGGSHVRATLRSSSVGRPRLGVARAAPLQGGVHEASGLSRNVLLTHKSIAVGATTPLPAKMARKPP